MNIIYKDEDHMVINGDSGEILPVLEDDSVDLVLTDPPYDFDEETKYYFHSHFTAISSSGVIVFSPPENQWVEPVDQYGFWIKPISTKNTIKRYSRFVEMIFFYDKLQWIIGRHWSQYTNVFNDLVDDNSLHPYRKPPSLIKRLILNHTKPGDTILDPFAGSGVLLDVCLELGRRSISIEKDSKHCNTILKLVM